MQAVKLKVTIRDHQIVTDLPKDLPDGEAEVIVLYEGAAPSDRPVPASESLSALFREFERSPHPRMTKEEIDHYIAEERAGWD